MMPMLSAVLGSLQISFNNNANLASIAFPQLTWVSNALLLSDNSMHSLVLPSLRRIGASLSVFSNPALTLLSFPVLASLGNQSVQSVVEIYGNAPIFVVPSNLGALWRGHRCFVFNGSYVPPNATFTKCA